MAMVRATEAGDIAQTKALLSRAPLLDHWVPYNAHCWSQLAAAAGQLDLMKFWREREKTTRTAKKRASPESLLFWAMGEQYIRSDSGDPLGVATHLLEQGASVDGDLKEYTPLHRAVFRNRPELVELLIRRGADLSRRYATGESALQIAARIQTDKRCATLLELAGAPLTLPQKPQRAKPIRTVDLRADAMKLQAGIERAARSFARQHRREAVTVIALASIPHEGYVMIAFDTESFEIRPWDCKYNEFAYVKFPEWSRAHDADAMRVIDLKGKSAQKQPDAFLPKFKAMIVMVLKLLEQKGAFNVLTLAKGCRIGIEMTGIGEDKFWELRRA